MKARQVGHRLTQCWMTLFLVAVAWMEPDSLSAHVLERAGVWGYAVTSLLAAMAVLGLADTIINDMMPPRYRLCRVPEARHTLYVAIALCHLSYLYVMAVHDEVTWLAGQYVGLAMSAIWIACFDVVYHRQAEAARA